MQDYAKDQGYERRGVSYSCGPPPPSKSYDINGAMPRGMIYANSKNYQSFYGKGRFSYT